MRAEAPRRIAPSARFFALSIIAVAVVDIAFGTLDPMEPIPVEMPGSTAIAYSAAFVMLFAGGGILFRRTVTAAAAVLATYYAVIVALLMNVTAIVSAPFIYASFFGFFEGTALASASLIIFAEHGAIDGRLALRLTRLARIAFALCVLFFGGAHLVYPSATIPLVPAWLPPSQAFWAFATGLFHIAAGLSLLSGYWPRLAMILLTIMYAAFTPLVHIPLLLSDPTKHFFWTENVLNLALVGAAWVVAAWFGGPRTTPADVEVSHENGISRALADRDQRTAKSLVLSDQPKSGSFSAAGRFNEACDVSLDRI